jgi:hypothetical protein
MSADSVPSSKTNIIQNKLIYCRHFRTYSRCAMFDWSDTVFRRRNVTRRRISNTVLQPRYWGREADSPEDCRWSKPEVYPPFWYCANKTQDRFRLKKSNEDNKDCNTLFSKILWSILKYLTFLTNRFCIWNGNKRWTQTYDVMSGLWSHLSTNDVMSVLLLTFTQ